MENGLESFGVTREDVLRAYFLAAACIFEPRRAAERLAWARATLLANTISAHLRSNRQDKKKLGCFVRCLDEEADGPR
jgi:ent-copalyl diphosphate synthase